MTFQQWLSSRNIDANELTDELRQALVAQYERNFPPVEDTQKCVPSILLILDDTPEERWSRAIRLEVGA